jgi:hypothetical protein
VPLADASPAFDEQQEIEEEEEEEQPQVKKHELLL